MRLSVSPATPFSDVSVGYNFLGFWANYIMGHFKGYFQGAKTFLPLNCPRFWHLEGLLRHQIRSWRREWSSPSRWRRPTLSPPPCHRRSVVQRMTLFSCRGQWWRTEDCPPSLSLLIGQQSQAEDPHCIKAKYYPAQKSVTIHSGTDTKAMHSFTAQIFFLHSSEMTMDTVLLQSTAFGMWKQIWQRNTLVMTLPTPQVSRTPLSCLTGLSLADWTRPSFASCTL